MDSLGDGWYAATMDLGESRCEWFDICINKEKSLTIYPAVHNASSRIWICGPDEKSEGRKWIIDGRDMEVPAGTIYQIRVKWSTSKMQVEWSHSTQDEDTAATALNFEHTYYIAGSFSKWKCIALMSSPDGEGSWEGHFTVGGQGFEDFQFLRDKDWQQALYPAKHK